MTSPGASRTRVFLTSLLGLLLAASCGGGGGGGGSSVQLPPQPGPPATPPPPAEIPVTVVLTTNDQATRMAEQSPATFSAPGANIQPIDDNTIVVDENQRYQTVVGFGAAFTDASTWLLVRVATPAAREEAMNNLFTRNGQGIGLNAMRTTIGATDLSRYHYSYDDMPRGQTDPTLANFSIDVDRPEHIPIIQQAKQLNPQMKLLASLWSAPGWMKTSDSLLGGTLLPSAYEAYTQYFIKYLQAYAAEGINADYISHQNEPEFSPHDYPGMPVDAETQTLLLREFILPAFRANNITTRVLIYDHNWDGADFPMHVLSDPELLSSDLIAGTAWHWYGGTPGAMTTVHNLFPTKGNYVTEASSGAWISDPVTNDFEMITQSMRNWSRSFIKWGLALDENRGPHAGGCDTCAPLVTVNSQTGSVSYEIGYYTLGHYSKYVQPDATRVFSSDATGRISVAFLNPDGWKALVVFNDSASDSPFRVVWGTQEFSYSLPPYSGATFTWSGTQAGGYRIPATTKIQAASYSDVRGLQTETTAEEEGGYNVGYASDESHAIYRNIEFTPEVTAVEARVANPGRARNGSRLQFRLDSLTGPLIATVEIPDTGGFQNWETASAPVARVSGIHDLYVVFEGDGTIGNLKWFRFR